MFVMELTYIAPIEAVEEQMDAHIAWLDGHYAAGVFLASGRKVPRDGGVVLAGGVSRAEIEKIAADDPFTVAGVCEYRITEFIATKTSADLATVRETPLP
ncbi:MULTISPECIES: YciI family protein [unclassified Streptomyces]|uniref:YciI family protein n=1 Tax=unclassified Streptomyces TaxID=2593676 RepID=UPI00225913F5|nr:MULTISPECIES: YciI family protein [unclassified Streptomyces]MCX4528977.1 YciI family protein [Streptomyces sp. NBC_01551]MCX4540339.1 YciI family protein [Streptomyces sp. NBC_01565]